MTNMSIQPLWLTHFIEILLVLEFRLIKFIVGMFSYKAHFRPQIFSNDYLDQLYNIISSKEDYINPTTDGNLSWKNVISCMSESGEVNENWQNRIHEVSMRICAQITRVVRIVGATASVFPTYEGLPNLAYFLVDLNKKS